LLKIGVLTGGDGRDDVSQQLSPLGAIEWCERVDALVDRATEGGLDAVVTGLQDEVGRSIAPTLVDLAARRPKLPVIVYARVNRDTIEKLLAVFALGLRMECVVRPFARIEPVLRHMLSPSHRPGVAPLLLHHFMPHVPMALRVFIALTILVGPARRGVEEVARWSGVSSRTIERRLRHAGWPAAHVVLRSFSALDAVWLMTEYGWSARRVQLVRAFPHPSSVTRLLARYAGSRPATLSEDGGFAAALERVTGVLLTRSTRQRSL
jgi:DNA-binding phage protein